MENKEWCNSEWLEKKHRELWGILSQAKVFLAKDEVYSAFNFADELPKFEELTDVNEKFILIKLKWTSCFACGEALRRVLTKYSLDEEERNVDFLQADRAEKISRILQKYHPKCCSLCPLDWGRRTCEEIGTLYYVWNSTPDMEEYVEAAKKISELEWKEK